MFSDDFTRDPADPAPLSPWQAVSGSWTVAGGVLSGTGAYGNMVWDYGNIYYVPPSAPPSDYVVNARVRLTADALGGGIGGRLDPATGAHYGIWLYPPDGGAGNKNNIALVKFSSWTSYSTPAITTFTVDANWHDLRVEFAGARIQASLDGTELIDYTDPSPLSGSGITVDTYPPGSISVDQVTMTTPVEFGTSGSLVSSAFDAGAGSTWQALSWTASTPAGTTLRLRTRTSATSAGLAGAAWSAWYAASGATIPDPAGRWLQYEADLGTSDPSITPFLYDVTATYATAPVSHTLSGTVTAAGTGVDRRHRLRVQGRRLVLRRQRRHGRHRRRLQPEPARRATYKLWIQTNRAGYPDQAYGPDGTFEHATPIDLTAGNADRRRRRSRAAPTPCRAPSRPPAPGSRAPSSTCSRPATSSYVGNAIDRHRRRLQPVPAAGHLQAVDPDQQGGLPRPGLRTRRHLRARHLDRPHRRQQHRRRRARGAAPTPCRAPSPRPAPGSTGAIVYVFDAGTSAYVGNAITGTGGAYTLSLPPGHYKLWIQTNKAGYPDQAYGPDGTFEHATPIDLTAGNQPPPTSCSRAAPTPCRAPSPRPAPGSRAPSSTCSRPATSSYAGNAITAGTGGAYSLALPPGTYKLWIQTNMAGYPDQAYGPDGTFEHATSIDLTAGNADRQRRRSRAAPTPCRAPSPRPGTGVKGAIVYVFKAGDVVLRRQRHRPAPAAPTACPCRRAPTSCGSRPTRRATPTRPTDPTAPSSTPPRSTSPPATPPRTSCSFAAP